MPEHCEMIQVHWHSDRWTCWPLWIWVAGWHNEKLEKDAFSYLLSLLQFRYFDISFSPSSLSSSIHAYGRLCGRNFNLKHMRGNPTLCCSLMGHHGIGVCREWLNFVRRPGTIKSRLPLCNRPFPSHNVTSGKTWRSRRGAKGWKPQSLDQTTEKCIFFLRNDSRQYITKKKLSYHIRKELNEIHHIKCRDGELSCFYGCKWVFLHCNAWLLIFPHRQKHMSYIQNLPYCFKFYYKSVSCLFFLFFFPLDSLHLLGPLWQFVDKNAATSRH